MGKYMRKSKLAGELSVMEVSRQSSIGSAQSSIASAQSSIGVRTRARTLALQRLQKPTADNFSSPCYLQLRSRRLEKPSIAVKSTGFHDPMSRPLAESSPEADAGGAEASFGENVLESEATDRNVREKTPCSLMIRSSEAARTPSSATRPTALACRVRNARHQSIPSAHEMEEFFAGSERLQQRAFIDKYNFDPVNDCPLAGRYEWVELNS
ncbi:Cyclin-dependent kinase inhibitor 3 [Platanthera zijinensis]|uniref:Cyclin-dependent kinase inhibitor n=1 Tax=Platanthera zijinensis TaxID=2320716 RepID=A0AAP0BKT6_9ASPA